MINKKMSIIKISKITIISALYIALSLALAPISFGTIQMRFSEILVLICFINKSYSVGIVIGCFITNLFSPFGLIDVIVGTLSTALAVFFASKSKKLFTAALWITACCIPVVVELYIMTKVNFWIIFAQVIIGEFIVVNIFGFIIFKIIMKNQKILNILK